MSGKLPPTAEKAWIHVKALKGSGQSKPSIVKRRSDGAEGVLKLANPDPAQRARVVREIEVLESLEHPSIVTLLDSDLQAEQPWLVTPRGVPLDTWWKKEAPSMSPEGRAAEAARVCFELLSGLALAHARGIVHRDIKPQNAILLGEQRTPVLIDFGIAFVAGDERLTEIDGRAVANKFAAPPAAYYGMIDKPLPWWDCLGIAWLWGWLLAEGQPPKDLRFHWKYHRMIGHEDADRVRALAAACSMEDSAPRDATAMLHLADRLGLRRQLSTRSKETGGGRFARAVSAQQREFRTALMVDQERAEKVEAAAHVLGDIYERVRDELLETAGEAKRAGLRIRTDLAINGMPVASQLRALRNRTSGTVTLFQIEGDLPGGDSLRVWLDCEYRQLVAKSWPLLFRLHISPGPDYPDTDVVHLDSGRAYTNWASTPVGDDYFVDLLKRWLEDETHWTRDIR